MPEKVLRLNTSGASSRTYYRIYDNGTTYIAAVNTDIRENHAFITLSSHFKKCGFPVPTVLHVNSTGDAYLLNDLGDATLLDTIGTDFDQSTIDRYKTVLSWLVKFQVYGGKGLDFSVCYPRASYDEQSAIWDLHYFKYMFLKLSGIQHDEQQLEEEFKSLTGHLCRVVPEFFMYRDFQARNIMVNDDSLFFIDYQGGRKGAPQYDLASLLNQSRVAIPEAVKLDLKDYYIDLLQSHTKIDKQQFNHDYPGWGLIRVLQTLGTYAYRGFFEGKHHFIPGMRPAIKNAIALSKKFSAIVNIPYLSALLSEAEQTIRYTFPATDEQKLTVIINSFSYHRGLPRDYTGHGGGFVFDCRALPNPGREHLFSNLTGKDQPVTEYLGASDEVNNFMTQIEKIVSASVTNYQKRGFRSLQVNFGCTGGQHRSVYCAEQLLQRLRNMFPDTAFLINHTNKNNWPC